MDELVENWQRPPNITKPFAQEDFGSEEKQTASRFRDNKSQFVASIESDVLMQTLQDGIDALQQEVLSMQEVHGANQKKNKK